MFCDITKNKTAWNHIFLNIEGLEEVLWVCSLVSDIKGET
jgi:hypothetical protein